METKMMDAEGEVMNFGVLKSLNRSIDVIDIADEAGGILYKKVQKLDAVDDDEVYEDDIDTSEDYEDDTYTFDYYNNDDFRFFGLDNTIVDETPIQETLMSPRHMMMYSRLQGKLKDEDPLINLFRDILTILKKESFTSDDAYCFNEKVRQILENDIVLDWLKEEADESVMDEFEVLYIFGALKTLSWGTERRVILTPEKVEERMTLIKGDAFFDRASVGENRASIVSGVMSMIFGYCVTPVYLREKIGLHDYFFSEEFLAPMWI